MLQRCWTLTTKTRIDLYSLLLILWPACNIANAAERPIHRRGNSGQQPSRPNLTVRATSKKGQDHPQSGAMDVRLLSMRCVVTLTHFSGMIRVAEVLLCISLAMSAKRSCNYRQGTSTPIARKMRLFDLPYLHERESPVAVY